MSLLIGLYEAIHTVYARPLAQYHHQLSVELWALLKACSWMTDSAMLLIECGAGFGEVLLDVFASAVNLIHGTTLELAADCGLVAMNHLGDLGDCVQSGLFECLNLPPFI